MVHAGLLPDWSIRQGVVAGRKKSRRRCARDDYRDFLANMYGSKPERWDDGLAGWDRLRVIVNAMTRMRFCTPDGAMEFHANGRRAARRLSAPGIEARQDAERRSCSATGRRSA